MRAIYYAHERLPLSFAREIQTSRRATSTTFTRRHGYFDRKGQDLRCVRARTGISRCEGFMWYLYRCLTQFANYTCPRCNIQYCSLTCYRSQVREQVVTPLSESIAFLLPYRNTSNALSHSIVTMLYQSSSKNSYGNFVELVCY